MAEWGAELMHEGVQVRFPALVAFNNEQMAQVWHIASNALKPELAFPYNGAQFFLELFVWIRRPRHTLSGALLPRNGRGMELPLRCERERNEPCAVRFRQFLLRS